MLLLAVDRKNMVWLTEIEHCTFFFVFRWYFMLTEVKVLKHHGFVLQYSGEVEKSWITARWSRVELRLARCWEELWLARSCGWSQQRAAGEMNYGSPCQSGGLAGSCGNPEQALRLSLIRIRSLCVLAIAGAGLANWNSEFPVVRGVEHLLDGGVCGKFAFPPTHAVL
jgi:hypothetical protein